MACGSASDRFATPGFRFYPTEEELLGFYLRHRLAGTRPDVDRVIPVVDVYSYHPSQLRSMAGEVSARDTEQWFFFCPRAERELHGGRPARTTPSGYWKATGSPSCVVSAAANRVIGIKRTMHGRAPTGTKTRWKMKEYKVVVDDDDTFTTTSTAGAGAAMEPPTAAPPTTSPSNYPSGAAGNVNNLAAAVVVAGLQGESYSPEISSSEDAVIDWNSLIYCN
ncbi:hypothetical protein GUJ93_ZPchr0009g306 [Zizania palustris]|uniref:NAC domain-containing protein n=1 Tax=Zizania palustris TaxID=103762 RepID=A0A8J5RKM7_ZIZPA|nr:hypothetical protein GUJ93_ZPchr0009g306 [Zizania palustris]